VVGPLARIALVGLAALLASGCGQKKSAQPVLPTITAPPPTKVLTTPKPLVGPSGVIHVKTNLGVFAFRLTSKVSPNATTAFVKMTRAGFFNGLTFHRIVPGFVIQGGDPNGDGSGGPPTETHDVVPPGTRYTLGAVAMAKSGNQPPGTAGSQFFVVTARGVQFDGAFYAVIGHVTTGLRVVLKIGRQPTDPQTEAPLKRVVMRRVTYTRR
jgi:cyclophilin family peptidyl-prolyl cis-trans isomerase